MAEAREFARPVVSRGTSFHSNQTRRDLGEIWDQLMPTEPPAQHRPPGIIDAVDLEYGLREVETDGDDAGHGRSFPLVDTIQPYPGPRRGGPCHQMANGKWQMANGSCSIDTCRS